MTDIDLHGRYRGYIACLNQRDLRELGRFVDAKVHYNGRWIGLDGYRDMLEKDFSDIPDLFFDVRLLVVESDYVASRLKFECTPKGVFLGLPVNGKKVTFTENVFYEFQSGKIWQVWSVIDKAAIEAQL